MEEAGSQIVDSKLITFNINEKTKFILATVVIGESYLTKWKTFSQDAWFRYAQENDIGIVALTDNIVNPNSTYYKNPAWQKLLLPKLIMGRWPHIDAVCLIDSDILISPIARNIFNMVDNGYFGVVSQEYNLPYELWEIKRRMAFYRNRFYSNHYPLDSGLFASIEQVFNYASLPPQQDYFCSGVVVVPSTFAELLSNSFYEISKHNYTQSNTLAWEEPFLNYVIQSTDKVRWLDYRFHTLWNYEMAWKYPFLYELGSDISKSDTARKCVENSLLSCFFLHFAGAWYESLAWEISDLFQGSGISRMSSAYLDYLDKPVTGLPRGKVLPS